MLKGKYCLVNFKDSCAIETVLKINKIVCHVISSVNATLEGLMMQEKHTEMTFK